MKPLPWSDSGERGRRFGPPWPGWTAELMMTVAMSVQMVVDEGDVRAMSEGGETRK